MQTMGEQTMSYEPNTGHCDFLEDKASLTHSHTHSFMCRLCSFCALAAEVNSFNRNRVIHKPKIFTILLFAEMVCCPLVYILQIKVRDSHIEFKNNSEM